MPPEPSAELQSRMFKRPKGTPYQGGMESPPPNMLRTGFEGIMDMIRGAAGGGNDNTMNRLGQLAMAGLPFATAAGAANRGAQLTSLGLNPTNRGAELANMGLAPRAMRNSAYDDAGRFVGFESGVDEAFQNALPHRAVSFGGGPTNSPVLKGLSPSDKQYEMMMQGRWRQPR